MWLSQPRCGDRRLLDTAPRFGMPDNLYYRRARSCTSPGPVDTRYFLSRTGIPVRKGETIRLTGAYDNSAPAPARDGDHARLPRAATTRSRRRCAPLPADRRAADEARARPRRAAGGHGAAQPHSAPTGTRETFTTRRWPAPSRSPTARRSTCATTRFSPGHISLRGGRVADLALRRRDPAQRPARQRPARSSAARRSADGQTLHDALPRSPAATSCSVTCTR